MATRSVAWRRCCPDEVSRRFDESAGLTLYIVHQTGPTGFILKQDGVRKKVKVSLCSEYDAEWHVDLNNVGVAG